MSSSFGARPEQIGWITFARAAVQAVASPLGGYLGEGPIHPSQGSWVRCCSYILSDLTASHTLFQLFATPCKPHHVHHQHNCITCFDQMVVTGAQAYTCSQKQTQKCVCQSLDGLSTIQKCPLDCRMQVTSTTEYWFLHVDACSGRSLLVPLPSSPAQHRYEAFICVRYLLAAAQHTVQQHSYCFQS